MLPFGRRMRLLRKERELTLQQVADRTTKAGVHATGSGISGLETGRYTRPRPDFLVAWCEALGADPADFPELLIARAHVALGDGGNKLVNYDQDLPVDALEAVTAAWRSRRKGSHRG